MDQPGGNSHSPDKRWWEWRGSVEIKWTVTAYILEVTKQALGIDGMFRVGGGWWMERRHFDVWFLGKSKWVVVESSGGKTSGQPRDRFRTNHPQHHSLANEVRHRHLPRPIMGCHHIISWEFFYKPCLVPAFDEITQLRKGWEGQNWSPQW